jgi:hypothetical protein
VYSNPLTVSSSQTIKAFAVLTAWNDSAVSMGVYTINGTAPSPIFSIPGGTYPGQQILSMSSSLTGADVYYTLDGSTPSRGSTKYADPITILNSTTVQAITAKDNYSDSAISTATYNISAGVAVAVNFSTSQTIVTPTSGSASTSPAVTTMTALNQLVGINQISTLTLSGTGTFTWDVAPTNLITNVTINSGATLTGSPLTSGDGLSPSLGNGRLILEIGGLLTVNSGGVISMDGKGYGFGLANAPKQGASTSGSGSGVLNLANGGGGGASGVAVAAATCSVYFSNLLIKYLCLISSSLSITSNIFIINFISLLY